MGISIHFDTAEDLEYDFGIVKVLAVAVTVTMTALVGMVVVGQVAEFKNKQAYEKRMGDSQD